MKGKSVTSYQLTERRKSLDGQTKSQSEYSFWGGEKGRYEDN